MNKHIGSNLDELQLEREAHRKTQRQLEQVTELLRRVYQYAPISDQVRIDAALSQQAEPQNSCKWTRDDDTGAYETACGATWHLSDGGEPEEHGQYYCHHCGKQIDDEGADHE